MPFSPSKQTDPDDLTLEISMIKVVSKSALFFLYIGILFGFLLLLLVGFFLYLWGAHGYSRFNLWSLNGLVDLFYSYFLFAVFGGIPAFLTGGIVGYLFYRKGHLSFFTIGGGGLLLSFLCSLLHPIAGEFPLLIAIITGVGLLSTLLTYWIYLKVNVSPLFMGIRLYVFLIPWVLGLVWVLNDFF